MRLVDREQGEPAAGEEVEEAQSLEPLGGHVDEVELALTHGALDAHRLLEAERRVEDGRAHPELTRAATWSCISAMSGETTDRQAVEAQGGNLVAERLAATGRHEDERVAAGQDVADHLLLQAAESGVAPDLAQHVERVADGPRPSRERRPQARSSISTASASASFFNTSIDGLRRPASTWER